MLIGKIDTCLESGYSPEIIKTVLAYLASLDLSLLEAGRYEIPFIDKTHAWFVILSYQTTPLEKQKPEVHRHYSDLQIVLSGQEKMAWCIDNQQFALDGDYLPERDIQYYRFEQDKLNLLSTKSGYFYLFTPSVVHATNIIDQQISSVRKCVVKIHNSLLLEEA